MRPIASTIGPRQSGRWASASWHGERPVATRAPTRHRLQPPHNSKSLSPPSRSPDLPLSFNQAPCVVGITYSGRRKPFLQQAGLRSPWRFSEPANQTDPHTDFARTPPVAQRSRLSSSLRQPWRLFRSLQIKTLISFASFGPRSPAPPYSRSHGARPDLHHKSRYVSRGLVVTGPRPIVRTLPLPARAPIPSSSGRRFFLQRPHRRP